MFLARFGPFQSIYAKASCFLVNGRLHRSDAVTTTYTQEEPTIWTYQMPEMWDPKFPSTLHTSHLAHVQLYPNCLTQRIPIPLLVEEHIDSALEHLKKARFIISHFKFLTYLMQHLTSSTSVHKHFTKTLIPTEQTDRNP